jgi:hypothetical protein
MKLTYPTVVLGWLILCVSIGSATGQDRKISVIKGKKLILNGSVANERDRTYFFKAREGQAVSIKLTGDDAALFILFAQHSFDAEPFGEETGMTTWSGRLPRAHSGEYAIRVASYFKVAKYRLEVLLK